MNATELNGVRYVTGPAVMDGDRPTCAGCAGIPNGKLCLALPNCMTQPAPVIWIKEQS